MLENNFDITLNGKEITDIPEDLFIPPDALRVILEQFEGPLDLLLYLIKKQNIDIIDIPILPITTQYVNYINMMQQMQFELASDYLVMASTLAEIKSKMLVPNDIEDEEEILELTDVISDEDDSILLDDVVDPDDLPEEPITNEDLADDIRKNLNLDESSFLSDLSIDDIIRETIKETLNEWFANNLKPIVEESVKEEVAKLFKKRN